MGTLQVRAVPELVTLVVVGNAGLYLCLDVTTTQAGPSYPPHPRVPPCSTVGASIDHNRCSEKAGSGEIRV